MPNDESISYWDCDGVPVCVVNRLATAYDVPGGRMFRSVPKPGSWDRQIAKQAFEALVAEIGKLSKGKDLAK